MAGLVGVILLAQESAVAELATYTEYMPEDLHANAYAITGWIAALFFTEGLRNLPEGEELTWDSYMNALESQPLVNPFGGEIDYANGKREGTTVMNLSKVNPASATGTGWEVVHPLQSMDEILGNN